MTKLLEQALDAVWRLPTEAQDEIARAMLHLASRAGELEPLDPAHLAAVLEGLAQAKRYEYATGAKIEALHGFLRGSVTIPPGADLTVPVAEAACTTDGGKLHR